MQRQAALFLDRDGVVNEDRAYVHREEDFEFIDGVFDLCRHAKSLHYLIFVVTNQAGIGRGYYGEEDFHRLTRWMCERFAAQGGKVDKVYYCPFHPVHGVGKYKLDSPMRKPAPGMILQAAGEFNVDLERSVLVGDMETDIQAGVAAGVGCNLLYRAHGQTPAPSTAATRQVERLADVCSYLTRGAL